MSTLTQASHEWATRPADQRFTSLTALAEHCRHIRDNSRATVVSSRSLAALPTEDNKGLLLQGGNGHAYAPSHWAFGQLAQLAEAPAGYMRSIPSPLAADCINYGLHVKRDVEDVGILLYRNGGEPIVRAATGPRYGRVWNSTVADALVNRFGDGLTGDFRVPGEFGKQIEVNERNTTLYASDRDMFVFLADEEHRIELPGRRPGETGSFARGFFVWNSEVGAQTLGISTFLFDYVCCNRIVWGAQDVNTIKIRHSVSAPDRFLEEVTPAIERYAAGSATGIVAAIEDARGHRLSDVSEFLAKRFSKGIVERIENAHINDEHRPIETRWDAVVGITAYARTIQHQDKRVEVERKAGELMAA